MRGSYISSMRTVVPWCLALALCSVACAQAREAAKAHNDPTNVLLDAVKACSFYQLAPVEARNPEADRLCEALLSQCEGPADAD